MSRHWSTAALIRSWTAVADPRFAAIIGEDLDLRLVMQLQHFAQRETDRVLAQVGGDIADPQPLVGPDLFPRRARPKPGPSGTARRTSCCTVALGELEHRIVGEGGERDRRHRGQQLLPRYVLRWRREAGHLHCRCRTANQCCPASVLSGRSSIAWRNASSAAANCSEASRTRPTFCKRHQLVTDALRSHARARFCELTPLADRQG